MSALVEETEHLKDDGSEEGESGPLSPLTVVYCPHCTLPPEFCENGPCYDRCLPWLTENFPQYLSEAQLERSMAAASISESGTGDGAEVTFFCFLFNQSYQTTDCIF